MHKSLPFLIWIVATALILVGCGLKMKNRKKDTRGKKKRDEFGLTNGWSSCAGAKIIG